jgi:hypothetical protein
MRFVQFVRKQSADGHLSRAELDERTEGIFRAATIPELEAVVADLPGASVLSIDAAIAGEWQSKPARGGSWLRRLVIYTVIVDALGVILWAFTGGGLVWLVLLFMCSAAVFAFRVTRRGKGIIGGRSRRGRR